MLVDDSLLWWASGWLRGIRPDNDTRLLHRHRLGPHLQSSHVSPQHLANFKPTVRPYDERMAAVWRGFSSAERVDDHTQLRHRVHPAGRLA